MKINIQQKLHDKKMSRYELAKRIGVTYPTIDNIYKGNSTSIKLDILESICKELDCLPIEILIFDDPIMKERQKERLLAYYNAINSHTNNDIQNNKP